MNRDQLEHLLRASAAITDEGEIGVIGSGRVLGSRAGELRAPTARYREFVESGMDEDDLDLREMLRASPLGISDEAFRRWVRELHTEVT